MPKLFTLPKAIPLDINGDLIAGAKLWFYITGTTNAQDTYSDPGLTSPHANPVVADGNGVFPPIFLDPSLDYKVDLTNASDVSFSGYPVNDIAMRGEAADIQIADAGSYLAATTVEAAAPAT